MFLLWGEKEQHLRMLPTAITCLRKCLDCLWHGAMLQGFVVHNGKMKIHLSISPRLGSVERYDTQRTSSTEYTQKKF